MLLGNNDCSFEGQPAHNNERRHGQNRSPGLRAHLFPDLRDSGESDQLEIVSLNLSRFGVALELAHDVPVGTVYNIEIDGGESKVQSQVRIVSCDPIADGLYRAGGEFCQNEKLRPGN